MHFTLSFTLVGLISFLRLSPINANSDPCTGTMIGFRPSDEWLAKNPPTIVTLAIQASECGLNTRLHFPDIQTYAYFKVNHSCDRYHGCPYGDCYAFGGVFPQRNELVADFTNSISFFWHNVGGVKGCLVKPISNPQTGVFGFEQSLSGKYLDGKAPKSNAQLLHDSKYPTFLAVADKWQVWPQADRIPEFENQPLHPKCGLPCGPNQDPGQAKGSPDQYTPSPAADYKPPKGWKAGPRDTCFADHSTTPDTPSPTSNGTKSAGKPKGSLRGHCSKYCACMEDCTTCGGACSKNCKTKHKGCDQSTDCKS